MTGAFFLPKFSNPLRIGPGVLDTNVTGNDACEQGNQHKQEPISMNIPIIHIPSAEYCEFCKFL